MITIGTAFAATSLSITHFFHKSGVGYYIPLYQRPYSWDKENVERLLDDISSGVAALDPTSSNESILFLGTVILVLESQPRLHIKPLDPSGLPPAIYNVIDGQQRISTIAILASLLHYRIKTLVGSLPDDDSNYDEIRQASVLYLRPLLEVFSVDLLIGDPTRKPIVIRGSEDMWTLNGQDSKYPSEVSGFLASAIRSATKNTNFPSTDKKTLVGANVHMMNEFLDGVEQAHTGNHDFPPAWDIVKQILETDLWSFPRPTLIHTIANFPHPPLKLAASVCSLVQLFAFSHFLLQRCCFTEIVPTSERWAFDMFQSLNATGTPLTAIETFKPLVVNYFGEGFKGSSVDNDFHRVDELFKPMKTAADKSKLTRDYLTTFELVHNGTEKLSSRFSVQRDWLDSAFGNCGSSAQRADFVRQMGDLASYWKELKSFRVAGTSVFASLSGVSVQKKQIAGLSLLYLDDANHQMAYSVLSRFYAPILAKDAAAADEFAEACAAVAAFFTLWRSALPNAGLDDEYRTIMKSFLNWKVSDGAPPKADNLKSIFRSILSKRKIGTQPDWQKLASGYLRYDNARAVCRFALFITSHDTIRDPSSPGLMKEGMPGTALYLTPDKWKEDHCKSLEHVAPQAQSDGWDSTLYDDDDVQRIGNLTLLPIPINSAASSKGWIEKWIYYKHLAETNPANLAILEAQAKGLGFSPKPKSIAVLRKTPYQPHMASITELGTTGVWDKNLVDARSNRICDLLWKRLYDEWLA